MPIELTDSNFKETVSAADKVVMVDFWAPWCGPCKMQGPIVEDLAGEYKDKSGVVIAKMNVDENPTTSQEHQILSIPTLIIFKNGEVVERMVGLQSKDAIAASIEKYLN